MFWIYLAAHGIARKEEVTSVGLFHCCRGPQLCSVQGLQEEGIMQRQEFQVLRDYEFGAAFEGQARSTAYRVPAKVEVQNAATSSSSPAPFSQIPLQESGDRVRVWDINDARAQRIHRRIGEMIALDCEPFSVVKDQGFKQLIRELEPRYTLPSRKYFTECIISGMFTELKAELKKEIDDVAHFSFTTDVWTTNVSNDSLLSLTAHWLTDSFTKKTAVLHTQLLEESHTGTYLAEKLTQMLASWKISSDKVHLVF